jgi:ABC-2 type transport system ATP-binding protein
MDNAIEIVNLKKSFPPSGRGNRKPTEAVKGISLTVGRGEIYGILGPNGAGKTTTLRMLTTFSPIDAGQAWIAGLDLRRQPQEIRRRISYVSQLGGAGRFATFERSTR